MDMNLPENLKYSIEHTWLEVGSGSAAVGINDFAQNELSEIVYADLPRIGQQFKQNEVFGSIEAVKTVSDLFMPVGGEILEINTVLKDKPTLVNDEPYTSGWLVKIKINSPDEVNELLLPVNTRKRPADRVYFLNCNMNFQFVKAGI
jgi:glycine cleavage system H protein